MPGVLFVAFSIGLGRELRGATWASRGAPILLAIAGAAVLLAGVSLSLGQTGADTAASGIVFYGFVVTIFVCWWAQRADSRWGPFGGASLGFGIVAAAAIPVFFGNLTGHEGLEERIFVRLNDLKLAGWQDVARRGAARKRPKFVEGRIRLVDNRDPDGD